MGAVGGAGWSRFSAMTREQRERVLLSWGESRVPERRAVFQALRKAALLFYYIVPARDGGRNPAWDVIGYDGPLGPLPEAPSKALGLTPIDADTTLECDVVIVGSGAGGAAAAGVLAAAGLEVIVIESGRYYDDEDFDGGEYKAISNFYMGAPSATDDQSVGLIAGSCLGGGTVVNYSTSFRTPDEVRAEWAGLGVPAFTSDAVHGQPGRGVRAPGGQPGIQRAVDAGAEAPRGLRQARLARGRHATRRTALCAGPGVRVLRVGLPGRGQAVGGQDLAV